MSDSVPPTELPPADPVPTAGPPVEPVAAAAPEPAIAPAEPATTPPEPVAAVEPAVAAPVEPEPAVASPVAEASPPPIATPMTQAEARVPPAVAPAPQGDVPVPATGTKIVATASGPRFVAPGLRPGAGSPPTPARPAVNTVPLMPLGIPIRPAVVTVTTVVAPAAVAPAAVAPAARPVAPIPTAAAPPPVAKPVALPPALPTPAPAPLVAPPPLVAPVVDAPAPRSSESMKAVRGRKTTERFDRPRSSTPTPVLVAIGLGVGVVGTFLLMSLRRPPEPVAPPPMVSTPVAEERPAHVPAGQRSHEQWLSWTHDELSKVWRTAAEDGGRKRAERQLIALSRQLDDASNAEEADAVVRVARDQLRVLNGEEPLAARPAQQPLRDVTPRATEAPPAPEREPATPTEAPSRPDEPPPWMPRGIDEEERPAGEPTQEEAGRAGDPWAARRLLLQLYDNHRRKDMAGAKALLATLEERYGESPEAHAARGHLHFEEGRFVLALDALTRAGDVTLQAVQHRAFAALYLGRYDQVRALLDHEAVQDTKLRLIVDGPFRARLPLAADVLEARTEEGHYRVVTDLGLSRADLQALEQKLASAGPAEVEKARKKHKGLKELGEVMEKAFKAYDKLFSIDRPCDVVPTVFVFSDRAQFDSFSARLELGSTENALGYYLPGYRILVFYDEDAGEQQNGGLVSRATLETLLHETFHQWLDLYVDGAPHWFNEGLAEYFGISELTRTELRYGQVPQYQPSRLSVIKQAFSGDRMRPPLSLARFLTQDARQFMGSQVTVNYAQAWSFVHYLGASPGGQKLLRDYFVALREGADVDGAYDRVFSGLDLDAMEREWRQHVGRLR